MSKMNVHFSSATDDWATPQMFFDEMNAKYGPFDLDVCASKENAKCDLFYSKEDDGLNQNWNFVITPDGKTKEVEPGVFQLGITTHAVKKCWMNPPYGREIKHWIKKAYEESNKGCLVCCLLPARTDTRWFHDFIYNREGVSVEFLRGRLKFGGAKNSAPFPSMVVVFNPPKAKP